MPYKDKENKRLAVQRYRERHKDRDNKDNGNPMRDRHVIPEIPDVRIDMIVERIEVLEGRLDRIMRLIEKNGVYLDDY